MKTALQKWGNSLALRIPRTVAAELAVDVGQAVDLQIKQGRIVIAPLKKKQYELSHLLAGMTTKNRHAETLSGKRRGRETW
jgi:antitoxin MazE